MQFTNRRHKSSLRLSAIIFVIIPFFGWAQLIDNLKAKAFTDEPFFYTEFIKQNKVKTIRGEIKGKSKGSIMVPLNLEVEYHFDDSGRLDHILETHFKGNKIKDTVMVWFFYDEENRLIQKRRNDSYGYFSYHYEYDSLGRLLSEKYYREENLSNSKNEFIEGKKYLIVQENYKYYENEDGSLEKSYFNNYGKEYQRSTYSWDDDGNLIEEKTSLLLSGNWNKTTYEYDEHGRVTKKVISSNIQNNSSISYDYSYDEVGNLILVNEYRDGKHNNKKDILYKPTMLLDAAISYDVLTEYMRLTKYAFEFYE